MFTAQADQRRPVLATVLILALFVLANGRVEGQRYQHQVPMGEDQQNPGELSREFESGERVDKLASASGDQFYQKGQPLTDWYRQLSPNRPEFRDADNIQYLVIPDLAPGMQQQPNRGQQLVLDPYNFDVRALVDEFKRQSPLANPSRASRAFKPKLMSTARGFGKRAGSSRHATYADLLAAANPNSGLMATNGKMSGSAIRLVVN